jgi:outer membrane protein assembly factor BamB
MQFDAATRPVVAGTTLFAGSSREDCVFAIDTRSGDLKWRFFADGPVRFPPLAWEGRVYFVSDDGHLYCLEGASGALSWRFRGGPRERPILGNGRLVSTWPARGAPVLVDGTVYFAAGIWPFMGIFLHALDARTGRVLWTNEGDGSIYIPQPHRADSFAGVAPQGVLASAGDNLLVPGGRSVPACYDRRTGKLIHFRLADTQRRGGSEVAVAGEVYFCGGAVFDLETGLQVGELGATPVVAGESAFYAGRDNTGVAALRIPAIEVQETTDKSGKKTSKRQWPKVKASAFKAPRVEALIRAGDRLYGGSAGQVWALDPEGGATLWSADVEGTPVDLVAADDRLFVSTREGCLYCFGADRGQPAFFRRKAAAPSAPAEARARAVLEAAGVRSGYAIVHGAGDGRRIEDLVRQSDLRLVVVDPDAGKVGSLRSRLSEAGLYGPRVSVLPGDPGSFPFPPSLASLIVCGEGSLKDRESAGRLFSALRPYGGAAWVPQEAASADDLGAWLPEAAVRTGGDHLLITRPGAPPGAADWTHEHADAANTRVSADLRVRAPLGILWFGGSSNEGILPRHGHGPQPQVVDGRLFIQGPDVIRAMDIYTGRVLWETRLPGVGGLYNNVLHQPGANATGTNFVSAPDGVYVAYGTACARLDPATGRVMSEFTLPPAAGVKEPPLWGYLSLHEDLLVGGAEPLVGKLPVMPTDPRLGDDDPVQDMKSTISRRGFGKFDADNYSSSRRLVALGRHDGKARWQAVSRYGFRHNGICIGGGRLYAIDRYSGLQLDRMRKRGELPDAEPRLVALDLNTGKELWIAGSGVFGTWLSYSSGHDILVEAGRIAKDTLEDEAKGMRAWRASDGAALWERKDFQGPAMIQGDLILMAGKACDIRTGRPVARFHPLTGIPVEWIWTRQYGCNTPSASRNLLLFRSGAAGYFDLARDGGTGNFGGFRSSCTNNLVAAGGVLCVPDYTRTCTCSYQNQASVALMPMPEAEMWTYFGSTEVGGTIRRVGVNLGAPGDRRGEDGTLWIEHPGLAGKSPSVPVRTVPDKPEMFRFNALSVGGRGLPWVAASGARGLKTIAITLDKDGKKERFYDVWLHFLEPDPAAGPRPFHVSIQGREALRDFDPGREAGGPRRAVVKEFLRVPVKKDLVVELVPAGTAETVLCGVEVSTPYEIPFFRYALERWPADPYEVEVVSGEPLEEQAMGLVAALSRAGSAANLEVRRRPATDPSRKWVGGTPGLPGMIVRPPGGSERGKVVWAGPLVEESVARLLDSPARKEISRRLLDGDSAVWVLLESGEPGKDEAAAMRLETALRAAESALTLPPASGDPADRLITPSIPLRLEFSVVRVSRDDPAEEVFVRMLVAEEAGSPGKGEPMAFPVFGRGRVLQGVSIFEAPIAEACGILAARARGDDRRSGPGRDLLFTAAWNSLFRPPAPPAPLLKRGAAESPEEEAIADVTLPENGSSCRIWLGLAEGALGISLAVILVLLWRSRR